MEFNYRLLLTEMLHDYTERREATKSLKVYKTYTEIMADLVLALNMSTIQPTQPVQPEEAIEQNTPPFLDELRQARILEIENKIEQLDKRKNEAVGNQDFLLAAECVKIMKDLIRQKNEL
jgi:hypothetical protein